MTGFRAYMPESVREIVRRSLATVLSLDLRLDALPELSEEERAASGDFSVILPIHDAPEVTARCLSALRLYGGGAQVILIDDGSRLDSTRRLIQQTVEETSWEHIRHDVATRHSRACEAGCKRAKRPYLLLLNSDAIITPWTWRGPADAFASDPEIAVVGPSTCLIQEQLAAPARRVVLATGRTNRSTPLRTSTSVGTVGTISWTWTKPTARPSSSGAMSGSSATGSIRVFQTMETRRSCV